MSAGEDRPSPGATLQSSGRILRNGDARQREIAELAPWFHNLHLPGGAQTAPDHPLGDFPRFKWRQIEAAIPRDLSGARALDIGCNAGFYSFQLAARGASVMAIDLDEHYLQQARWAAERLDPDRRVTFEQAQVYDLARIDERFDLVLFLGVLYHLRHPLLALDLVATRVRAGGRLVLQTLTMPSAVGDRAEAQTESAPRDEVARVPDDLDIDERERLTGPGWPRAAFIEHRLAGDPTNWWAADDACVRAMVRSAGLEVVAAPGHEFYVCEPSAHPDPTASSLREAELRAVLGLDPVDGSRAGAGKHPVDGSRGGPRKPGAGQSPAGASQRK